VRRLAAVFSFVLLCVAGAAAQPALLTIHAAITPINYDAIPMLYALRTGMFAKAGLDVQLQRIPTGAAITAAVAGGTIDIGKSSSSPILTAVARGLPLTLIAPGAIYDEKTPNGALVVAKDSPLKTAADLSGQLIGTQTLNDIAQIGTAAWIDKHGGNSQSVRWVELPMTSAVAAIDEHRIVAGVITSPLLEDVLGGGKVRSFAPILSGVAPHFLFSVYFTTKEWAAAHPDAVKKFASVIVQSAAYTNAHHTEMNPLIADLVGMPVSVIERMSMAIGGTVLNAKDIQPVIDVGVKYHAIPRTFPAQEAIYKP
jgi:NitT/TauT family transport system substrate-binding protein